MRAMKLRGLSIVLAVFGALPRASADPTPDDNIQRADQLFSEARALLPTDLNKACEKFEESLKFNSQAIGTLLNVALCDEKLGRVATAIAKFTEARERAKEGGMTEHLKAAEQHITELALAAKASIEKIREQLLNLE